MSCGHYELYHKDFVTLFPMMVRALKMANDSFKSKQTQDELRNDASFAHLPSLGFGE